MVVIDVVKNKEASSALIITITSEREKRRDIRKKTHNYSNYHILLMHFFLSLDVVN